MTGRRVALVAVLAAGLVLGGCGDDGPEGSADGGGSTEAPGASTEATTGEPRPTERDYTASTGPSCTVGTVVEELPPPPGCDRLYSPFLSPGRECTEGQEPDCVDPDGDRRFTYIVGGGRCLVQRKDPDRCLDADGDGLLDEPLEGQLDEPLPGVPGCSMGTIPPDAPDIALPPGCEGTG